MAPARRPASRRRAKPRRASARQTSARAAPPTADSELVGQLRALLDSLAPGAVRAERLPGGAVRLETRGRGRRKLPGGRTDVRPRLLTVAYDGSFLQLAFRVAGRLRASDLLSFPMTSDLREVEDFVRAALKDMEPLRAGRG